MWKRLIAIINVFMVCFSFVSAQTTYSPVVRSKNNNCIIEKVQLTNDETIVTIKVPRSKQWGGWVRFSSATVLVPADAWSINDARRSRLRYPNFLPSSEHAQLYADAIRRIREGRETMSDAGFLIRSLGADQLDTKYKITGKGRDFYYFELHFDRLPHGCENVYIRELEDGGFEWVGIQINNPYPNVPNIGLNEAQIKQRIDSHNDGIVGIYEGFSDNKYKLACIKDGDEYKLIYMGSNEPLNQWYFGDVKAILRTSATPGFFKVNWYMANKTINTDVYAMFEGGSMKIVIDDEESGYLKMYPTSNFTNNPSALREWSGTGFALKKGYIVTNYHVIDGANTITVQGVKGNFNNSYKATVVGTDKNNDLALLKISDLSFPGFGTIPYSISSATSEVGEDIFVLGYPLTSTMGDEIKLTTGVISSKTGFQGDVTLYQISAPIQPGNSGGPLFDKKGNVIGVVSAKHTGAENVGYAIKSMYLRNLIESAVNSTIIPTSNTVSTLPLTSKVKSEKNFVFMIRCSSITNSNSAYSASTGSNGNFDSVTINNPSVTSSTELRLRITKVIANETETIVEFRGNNKSWTGYYTWIAISPYTYIMANGKQYTLKKAEGIAIDPKKTYFNHPTYYSFKLIFPSIPSDVSSFDLIESDESDWKFYGVRIR